MDDGSPAARGYTKSCAPGAGASSDVPDLRANADSRPLTTAMARSLTVAEAALRQERALLLESAAELRRILHPLRMGAEALIRCGDLAPAARAIIGQQIRSVDDTAQFVDALVHAEELAAGLRRPVEIPFDLARLVADAVRAHADAARARGVAVRTDVPVAWVRGDPALTHDLLGLLLAGLVRAGAGTIVTLQARDEGTDLLLSLRADDPAGVDATARNARAVRPAGVTLGARLAARIAERSGCALRTSPAAGILTAAELRLPRAARTGCAERQRAPRRTPHTGGLHALVIDDDPATRIATRLLLESEGVDVRVASCCAEALSSVAAEIPDVLVADAQLACGESGIAAVAAVRSRCGRDVPAVLVTSEPAGAGPDECTVVLAKPFPVARLIEAIDEVATQIRGLGPRAAAREDFSAVPRSS